MFNCEYCNKIFKNKTDLKNHRNKVHSDKFKYNFI